MAAQTAQFQVSRAIGKIDRSEEAIEASEHAHTPNCAFARTTPAVLKDIQQAKPQAVKVKNSDKGSQVEDYDKVGSNIDHMSATTSSRQSQPVDILDDEARLSFSAASTDIAQPPARHSAEARLVTGELPSTLRPRTWARRNVPENPDVIRAANRVLNSYKRRKKKGHTFEEVEMEVVRAAGRILSGDYYRRKKAAPEPSSQ